jgi:TM2 domain-containing membrane protein YozV
MSGFGRKGVTEGRGGQEPLEMGIDALRNGIHRPVARPAAQHSAPIDSDLARKREAFLAAERARGQSGPRIDSIDTSQFRSFSAKPERSLPMAYLIWFLLCNVSGHRFYLGAYRSAMIHISMTLVGMALVLSGSIPLGATLWGASMVWALGDVFFIHKLHRNLCRQREDFGTAFA